MRYDLALCLAKQDGFAKLEKAQQLLESLPGRKAYVLNTFELSRRMFLVRQQLQNGTLDLIAL